MTITLYLQKETLLRDLATLSIIFQVKINSVEEIRKYYEPLKITTEPKDGFKSVAIQVTPEEFALIGVFNGGI